MNRDGRGRKLFLSLNFPVKKKLRLRNAGTCFDSKRAENNKLHLVTPKFLVSSYENIFSKLVRYYVMILYF